MTLTRFLECERCGGHASALQGVWGRPNCLDCLDREGPSYRYICSVAGCRNQPVILAVVEERKAASVLLCERHFMEARDSITTFLEVPVWLTEVDDIHTDDDSVVFDIEFDTEDAEDDDDDEERGTPDGEPAHDRFTLEPDERSQRPLHNITGVNASTRS